MAIQFFIILVLLLVLILLLLSELNSKNVSSPILPIYIVSLPARKEDRLYTLLAKIKNSDSYYIKDINAVNGNNVVVEHYLNNGQIGCWLSHVYFWKLIVSQKEPYALILEDDADIYLPEMFQSIVTILNKLPRLWDLCYLGGWYLDNNPIYINRIALTENQNIVQSKTSKLYQTHAYLITKKCANKLLKQSNSFNTSYQRSSYKYISPVDDWMSAPERNIEIFKIEPNLISPLYDNISDTT